MSYSEEFKAATQTRFLKQDDACISLRTGEYGPYVYHTYNFLTRTMTVYAGENSGLKTYLFAELDRDVLGAMREKLIELGGKPPSLPPAENENKRALIEKAP